MKKYIIFACLFFTIFADTSFASSITNGKVYMIIEIEIKDNESYSKYFKKVPSIVKKYGGRYLARGGEITSIAGNWNPERIIVIEFESMERLRECFQSAEYSEIAPLRKKSTTSKAIVVSGIRVNVIAPTAVKTHSRESLLQGDILKMVLSRIPLGRLATQEDLICATIYLSSAASDFITGQTLFVDGGWVAKG